MVRGSKPTETNETSSSPEDFAEARGRTSSDVAGRKRGRLHLHVRSGAIPSRAVDPKQLLLSSLENSTIRWSVVSLRSAENAEVGKRQVKHMRTHAHPIDEVDLHAVSA